jgi:iron complex transport system substrate-binding protein
LKSGLMARAMATYFTVVMLSLLFSCGHHENVATPTVHADSTASYARRFSVVKEKGFMRLFLFSGNDPSDTTARYLLLRDEATKPADAGGYELIRVPCRKIAALGSIYAGMIAEMGAVDQLLAIDNIDYVSNREVIARHSGGKLHELARTPLIDIEKTLALSPDVVFSFGTDKDIGDQHRKLEAAGIPVVVCTDHLEETALARAEWIRLFGVFCGREAQADSIFRAVESSYAYLRELAGHASGRPTVFSEVRLGDTWFMPGGKSYIARLVADANGDYLWKDDDRAGSIPLSFEQVYARAAEGDYWINLSMAGSRSVLLQMDRRYGGFAAFRSGRMYNNTKNKNAFGYSDYWESGMAHPDRILHDLAWIFHPELRPQLRKDLYYYEQLE